MGSLVYITGSEYSGKHQFAEDMAKSKLQDILYIAMDKADSKENFDANTLFRGKLIRRSNQWVDLDDTLTKAKETVTILKSIVDFVDRHIEGRPNDVGIHEIGQKIDYEIEKLCRSISGYPGTVIVISSEVYTAGKADKQRGKIIGRVNRRIASCADEAWLVVSGIPTRIK